MCILPAMNVTLAPSRDGGVRAPSRHENWNHALFDYENRQGSRRMGPAFGVLKLIEDKRDAIAQAGLSRHMARAAVPPGR